MDNTTIEQKNGPLAKGFNAEQNKLYSQIFEYCVMFDITDDMNKQNETFDMIKRIIEMDNIDYCSKLFKIHALIGTSQCFENYMNKLRS